MRYKFSSNNSLNEFETIDTTKSVYLSFACEPQINAFSQKFKGSQYGSTTETLIDNLDKLKIEDPSETTITLHMVQGIVPLDGATACFAIQKSSEELQGKPWEYLQKYIGEVERGFTRPPFLNSLYAFYYASVVLSGQNYPGADQLDERNQYLLGTYHEVLDAVLSNGKIENFDSPCRFMELVPKTISVSAQSEVMKNEKEQYFTQDFERAENFELELPLKHKQPDSPISYNRVSMLALSDPRTALMKFFTRNPMRYPGKQDERSFPCTYVHNSKDKGKVHEHIISVPPTMECNLRGLADLLEVMEDRAREQNGDPPRARDNPRAGYDYNDPWYDERHSQHSILDTPGDGSRLERDDIMEALWDFGCPLKYIRAQHITTSIFIPLWASSSLKEELNESGNWSPFKYDSKALREFLPYMESIFKQTANIENSEKPLSAYVFKGPVEIRLDPQHILEEGPAVDVIRTNNQEHIESVLEKSRLKLRFFLYEYGLGLLELEVNPPSEVLSIRDSQWLEHFITLTPLNSLLGETFNTLELREEIPHKHFACTSLTGFGYEGGHLRAGRSIGGGIQMMVNDVEPIFKNLPFNEALETNQTIIDETSKRTYYCSSTSILNFDDTASQEEHEIAHISISALFNMVLAQRFILSKSRQDIVLAEVQYNLRKKRLTISKWMTSWILPRKNNAKGQEDIDISELREKIQHMTTNSWFNVVSNNESMQNVFEKLREQMKIEKFYQEVQDRSEDLDNFIAKKQADVQSRVFDIFTFIMSPLNLVIGFIGGYQFTRFTDDMDNPVPFLPIKMESGWYVFLSYFVFWSIIFALVWIIYKYKSAKE